MKTLSLLGLAVTLSFVTFSFKSQPITQINFETSYEAVGDCAKFVKDYEKFVDQYIVVLKKYKANPTDMAIMEDYTKLAAQATKFAGETPDDCGTMENLKIAKIAAKLNKELAKM